MSAKEDIKQRLNGRLMEALSLAKQTQVPLANANQIAPGFDPNHMVFGRVGLVNRIRGGKLQWRHTVSEQQGFKILDGNLVKMTPQEMRHRRIAARIGARKRAGEIAKIIRNRNVSLRKRDIRLNAYGA